MYMLFQMVQCPGFPNASSCACGKVQVILQARLHECTLISLFEGPLTADKKTGGHQITVLGSHCHFSTAVHNSFLHGLLIFVSPFHIRKANSVGVISFYGSQEFSNYIFHEAFSTVIFHYSIIGLPQQQIFLVWFVIYVFLQRQL